jgi:hypothetical protein
MLPLARLMLPFAGAGMVALGCGETASNGGQGAQAGQAMTAGAAGSSSSAGTTGASAGATGAGAGGADTAGSGGSSAGTSTGGAAAGTSATAGSGGSASGGSAAGGAAGNTGLVDCDPRKVLCRVLTPECPANEVPSVNGSCYGPCVKVDQCRCSVADECPQPDEYTCWAKQHCGPYVK